MFATAPQNRFNLGPGEKLKPPLVTSLGKLPVGPPCEVDANIGSL
ncbi:hypothetical protein ACVIEM_000322 [Rhizobium leguminosarum]